jgi:hypothetical protein
VVRVLVSEMKRLSERPYPIIAIPRETRKDDFLAYLDGTPTHEQVPLGKIAAEAAEELHLTRLQLEAEKQKALALQHQVLALCQRPVYSACRQDGVLVKDALTASVEMHRHVKCLVVAIAKSTLVELVGVLGATPELEAFAVKTLLDAYRDQTSKRTFDLDAEVEILKTRIRECIHTASTSPTPTYAPSSPSIPSTQSDKSP